MSTSLHDAVIKTYLQILPQVDHLLNKAQDHARDNGLEPSTLTEAYLARDMWPFAKQIFECGHHSARAIEGVRKGLFAPEPDPVPSDFAALKKEIEGALEVVDAVEPGELDQIAGQDMLFKFNDFEMPFTVADFLLSFSLPNFYFHSSTAYAILRNQGVSVGKTDFLGRVRKRN